MTYSPGYNSYTRINSQATTVLKVGSGVLHTITLAAAAVSAAINVYDNPTGVGTVIFSYTQGAAALAAPVTFIFDARFNTGLTIITSAANPDMTVTFS